MLLRTVFLALLHVSRYPEEPNWQKFAWNLATCLSGKEKRHGASHNLKSFESWQWTLFGDSLLSQISASFDSCKWLLMYETMIFIPWAYYNICLFCLCDCAIHLFSLWCSPVVWRVVWGREVRHIARVCSRNRLPREFRYKVVGESFFISWEILFALYASSITLEK